MFNIFIVLWESGFVCVSVGVSVHQREGEREASPKPVEAICSPKLLTAGLSVGRGKIWG